MRFEPARLALYQKTEGEAQAAVAICLAEDGFAASLPGLYIGRIGVDAVRTILAVQRLADCHTWFRPCLRDARLLRVEEDGDLTIALE